MYFLKPDILNPRVSCLQIFNVEPFYLVRQIYNFDCAVYLENLGVVINYEPNPVIYVYPESEVEVILEICNQFYNFP